MKTCDGCGHPLPDQYVRCPECGGAAEYVVYSTHGRVLDTFDDEAKAREKLAEWPQASYVLCPSRPAGKRVVEVKQ